MYDAILDSSENIKNDCTVFIEYLLEQMLNSFLDDSRTQSEGIKLKQGELRRVKNRYLFLEK